MQFRGEGVMHLNLQDVSKHGNEPVSPTPIDRPPPQAPCRAGLASWVIEQEEEGEGGGGGGGGGGGRGGGGGDTKRHCLFPFSVFDSAGERGG